MKPPQCMSNDNSILETVEDVLWRWCKYHGGDHIDPPSTEMSKITSDWYNNTGRHLHVRSRYFSNPDERQRLWNAVCDIEVEHGNST